MRDFMNIVLDGLVAIGLLAKKPPAKDVTAAARRVFEVADEDHSGQLSSEEFVRWGRTDEMVLQIIDRIERAKNESTRKVVDECGCAGHGSSGATGQPR